MHETAFDHFAKQCRGWEYAEKQKRSQMIWDGLAGNLTATYLHCQHRSMNWTQGEVVQVWRHDIEANAPWPEVPCTCSSVETRKVDLIDLLGRHHLKEVPFCKCLSDPIRLLYFGYLASSPTTPRTAFAIPLVQFHHRIWEFSAISATSFVDGLMAFHDDRSESRLLAKSHTHNSRELRRPFMQSVDLYRRILTYSRKLMDDLLQPSIADKWASKCPRCFGPALGEVKVSPDEPDFIIAMDGNFQHRHQTHASKDSPTNKDYPSSFIPPAQVDVHASVIKDTENRAKDLKTACSDSHTAANDVRNSTSWDRCDDTGLFGSACRHDVPLKLINIYKSGEKLHYPVTILDHILHDLPEKKVGVLYDIGCHLKAHIEKRQLLAQHDGRLLFGTSVFHAYAHQWRCQIFFNPRFIRLFGLSDGEGLERVWSDLSPLVSGLRISTRLHRLLSIHWRVIFFSERTTRATGNWLWRKLCNVFKVRFESKRVLTKLANFTNPSYPERTYNNDFFRAQWQLEREAYKAEKVAQHEMQLALARLLCLQEELDNFWKTPGVQLSPEQTLARTQSQQKLEASIAEQRQKIGSSTVGLLIDDDKNKLLLKLWYSKQDVRVKYLALCAEKRPLEDSRVPGKKSKLGTHGKTALLTAVRKHAVRLYQAIKLYNDRLSQFNARYPDHPFSPPPIVYKELFTMEADDAFWNDGLFTNANEPWAVDPHTQRGMRQFAYFERSEEEIRRIGWEVRRTMRWASSRYRTLFNNLEIQRKLFNDERHACLVVDRILAHPDLQIFPSRRDRRGVASNLFYNDFLEHVDLMETWNDDLLKAFRHTASQGDPGDEGNVWGMWRRHIIDIETMRHKGFLTTQLGSFRHYFWDDNREYHIGDDFDDNVNPPFYYSPEDEYVEDDDNDEEDQWIKTLDDEVLRFTIASAETNLYLNDLYD
ncbi:hypothetical protein DFH28DRAFT_1067209 [Melampsora americana]|nr:hypothetical protein DFH28DRAFT_1067209 [Melampsora americana]